MSNVSSSSEYNFDPSVIESFRQAGVNVDALAVRAFITQKLVVQLTESTILGDISTGSA